MTWALIALPSRMRVSPRERFGRLSCEDLMETASPGDGPGGLTPTRVLSCEDCLSARRGASGGLERPAARCALFPRLPRRDEGGGVLGVGIDWAEEFHLVALGRPAEGVIEVVRVEHHPQAVAALMARIAGLEPDPAEVRVVIETRHGLLAGALVAPGIRCCRSTRNWCRGAAARRARKTTPK